MKKLEDLGDGKVLYKSHRAEPYFSFIKNGVKTIEGRVLKKLYKDLKSEDEILVFNNEETDNLRVKVKDIVNYSFFEEMLKKEDYKKILPDVDSVENGIEVYRKFYTEKQEIEFGVIAIKIDIIR
ncbi:MAG: ASCH domain-containing protein [Candidatus Pacebacteria bacterium]|nr:ASCH domain-containing protein [Candidatus Paceibacterota bacterium]